VQPKTRDSICRAAYQHIRNNRQHNGDDQRFARINRLEDENLVDHVEYRGDHENLPYRSPTFSQSLQSVLGIGEDRKEVRRSARLRVSHAGNNSDERRNCRLNEEAKRKRAAQPAENMIPSTSKDSFSAYPPPLGRAREG
jgi:hypothetical protein